MNPSARDTPLPTAASFSVCVYCGSRSGAKPGYATLAHALGTAIGRRGWQLVYGGGQAGLMGIVAYAGLVWLRPDRQFFHDVLCGTRLVHWQPQLSKKTKSAA